MAVSEGMMRHLHRAQAQDDAGTRAATFIPEPEPRARRYTIISVDDHLVEPAHMFEGRLPAKLQEQAPRIVRQDDGSEPWFYDGRLLPMEGSNAVVGQADRSQVLEPAAFADMRKGSYDVHERIRDMDLGGVWASLKSWGNSTRRER